METIVLCSETQIGIVGIWASAWKTQIAVVAAVVQSLSCVRLFATPRTEAHQASLSFTISWSLLRFMSIESVMPSRHLILCYPLPPALNLSLHQVFSSESVLCIRWPKYWSFSICPSNGYSGLIPFRIDWFDLLAVQGFLRGFSSTTIRVHQMLGQNLKKGS